MAGAIWARGNPCAIRFTGGDEDDTASIDLYKGGVLQVPSLATNLNVATDRNFSWSIPADQTLGDDYMIRVTVNRNGSTSTADSGTFRIISDSPRVTASLPSPTSTVTGSVSPIVITFSKPMNPSSFSVASDVISFTGPGSADLKPAITGSAWSSGNTILSLQTSVLEDPGSYLLTLGSQIADSSGSLMNQDVDATDGETPDDRFVLSFSVEAPQSPVSSFPYFESFESGLGDWDQSAADTLNWTRDSGGTPSSNTGPGTGQNGNWYLYTEASSSTQDYGKTADLDCWFDLRLYRTAEISFHYHMFGDDMGDLSLLASTDGIQWLELWKLSGAQGNAWQIANANLDQFAGRHVQLRFRGETGDWWASDMAIDSISVDGVLENQAGELAFTQATFTVDEAQESASISVSRSNGSVDPVSVDYVTADNTAQAGLDYTASSGTLQWADGDLSPKTIEISILDDPIQESLFETLSITLSNSSSASLGSLTSTTLRIQDDDNNPPDVDAGEDKFAALDSVSTTPGLHYGTVPGNIDTGTPNPNTEVLVNVSSQTESSIASNPTEIYTGSLFDADGQISFTEHID